MQSCQSTEEFNEKYKSIYKIQSNTRRRLLNKNIKLRVLAYINRKLCNNDEDFYTYEPVQEIEDLYFFSYQDDQNNHWGFDVRSLKKLIDNELW